MSLSNSTTSLKIGAGIGVIIMLLGIAILFGVWQTAKTSQEVIQISEEYIPLNEMVTEIRYQKSNQALNFEKIVGHSDQNDIENLEKAKEGFWVNSEKILSDISKSKNIIQAGKDFSAENRIANFENLNQKMNEIENSYLEYEQLVREFLILEFLNSKNTLLAQIDKKEIDINNDLNQVSTTLTFYTDDATYQIEVNEESSLQGQIIIITLVGIIAGTLGFFISQINSELKKEVDFKTIELRKANEKLKELDVLKNEFIGIASHELKSPIQPIFGFAELAKSGDIDQNEAWDGVTELATKLQDLANDVLDVSKIESNTLKLHIEKVRINEFIKQTVDTLKINLKPGIIIQENLDKEIEIEIDKMRLGQVFRNILGNAIKFTDKGQILIETIVIEEDNKISFKISDSGRGIPDDILPKIFEKFVTQGNQNGTGLGLFLSKGIVDAHKGMITAKNNSEKGATIEFSLPISREEKVKNLVKIFRN